MNRSARAHPHKVIACREYDILVPFVCHRCGTCCRKYEPSIDFEMLPEIAQCLGEPIDVIQNRLGDNSRSHRAGHQTDCCFLDPRHLRCLIHEVRPTACRQFPALDGAGPVDCPGYREYKSVLNEFTTRLKEVPCNPARSSRGRRPLPPDACEDAHQTLAAARASDPYRQVFEALNG